MQIRRWWKQWPNANIGGAGGALICLDVDAKSGGFESLRDLEDEYGEVPAGAVVKTGKAGRRRGRHYWFSNPDGLAVATRAGLRPGIDIRAVGGYAVLPPSRHASGVNYGWDGTPTIDPAPEWIIALAPEYVESTSTWEPNKDFHPSKEVRDFVAGKHAVEQGEQRQFLTRAARSLLTTGKSVEEVARLLHEGKDGDGGLAACDQDDSEPRAEEDVLDLVGDIFRKGPTTARRLRESATMGC